MGDLPLYLTNERERGISYRAVAAKLSTAGIDVTAEAVRLWCIRLGIK